MGKRSVNGPMRSTVCCYASKLCYVTVNAPSKTLEWTVSLSSRCYPTTFSQKYMTSFSKANTAIITAPCKCASDISVIHSGNLIGKQLNWITSALEGAAICHKRVKYSLNMCLSFLSSVTPGTYIWQVTEYQWYMTPQNIASTTGYLVLSKMAQ
jgi:hypothetical protein